jgi:hypothetical protein
MLCVNMPNVPFGGRLRVSTNRQKGTRTPSLEIATTDEKIFFESKQNKLSARYRALPFSLGDIVVGNHLPLSRRARCAMAIGLDFVFAV